MPVSDYDPIFQAAGAEWNVDPTLLKSIAAQESSGVPTAVSPKGAVGLMGIMPGTANDLGVANPKDPTQSIFGGAKYFSQLLDKYGDPQKALAAYNAGPGRVDAVLAGKSTLPAETAGYLPAVAGHYQQFAGGAPTKAPANSNAPMSDDAFLKHITAPAQTTQDDAAFLSHIGAQPAAASAPAEQPSITIDPTTGAPIPTTEVTVTAHRAPAPGDAAVERIGQAAVQGYQQSPSILTPAAKAAVDAGGPMGRFVVNPLLSVAGVGWGALQGLGSGIAQAVTEGAQAIGQPALGRDVNMGLQIAPFARLGTGLPLTPATEPGPLAAPRLTQAQFDAALPMETLFPRRAIAPPAVVENPAAVAANAPAFAPPGATIPPGVAATPAFVPPGAATDITGRSVPVVNPLQRVPPGAVPNPLVEATMPAPAPGAVGAAATVPAEAALTPAQTQAYRSQAEVQKLTEAQPVGVPDTNRYVPGVEPTAAHMEQSANTSREEKLLESQIPDEFKQVAADNNEARRDYVNQIVPSDVEIQAAKDTREAQRLVDTDAAWKNKGPADVAPLTETAKEILTGPDGKIESVETAVNRLMNGLKNKDGSFETDPQRLYGVRRDLANAYSKAVVATEPAKAAGAAAIGDLLPVLDSVIERAAPGYRVYMDNYAKNSAVIDAGEALNKYLPKLYDTQGRMQLSRVQSMMKDIVTARSAPGLNPFKAIPDERIAALWNLRDDLRRVASAQELAKARGSDTTQNFGDLLKQGAKIGATLGAHALLDTAVGPAGSLILNAGRGALNAVKASAAERQLRTRAGQMARPDPTKYPPPNPLE